MSVQSLFPEIRPNLEIFQVIKAADQLFYKDKVHYVELQPIFISANKKDKIEIDNNVVNHPTNKSSENVHGFKKEKGEIQNAKKEKKEVKKEKIDVQNIKKERIEIQNSKMKENKTQHNFGTYESSTSKLQQAIIQAQKTIENARNVGSNSSIKICEPPSSSINELLSLRSENAFLCKKLELQEKTINRLEKITQKLLKKSGMTEADLSD